MNEIEKENEYVGYEYKEVTTSRELESMYVDSYPQFGWTFDNKATTLGAINSVSLRFKRPRKLKNKAELARCQRQFDNMVCDIKGLTKSKTLAASVTSSVIGVVGTALMAGSVFAYLAHMIIVCVVLAVPAFIGWIIPYFVYTLMAKKKAAKINPKIEQKYDEIDELCAKANALI